MHLLLFFLTKIIIGSISTIYPINIDCGITNNPLWIVYEHWIWLPITGRFSMWVFLALNRVNNNRFIFEVMSPIKIQIKPCPGLVQFLTLTVYSSELMSFTWSWRLTNVVRYIQPQSADTCHCSGVRCFLLRCNGYRELSNAGVDRNFRWNFMWIFDWFKNIVTEITTDHWFEFVRKIMINKILETYR